MSRTRAACRWLAVLAATLLSLSGAAALAQVPAQPEEPWQPAPPDWDRGRASELPTPAPPAVKPRLFRMPLDLRPADDIPPSRLQVQVGPDRSFFDLRRPGEPGGVGYRRLNTQLQLLDLGPTGVVVGVQAVRPSGLEYDGLNDGPTVVSPMVGLVHDLGDGTALQGFVGKDVRPGSPGAENLDRNLQYGMALQTPLLGRPRGAGQNLYLFVEALGRYRHDSDASRAAPAAWEVLPGMHWRSGETWWLSGGVLLPVGTGRPENGLLQITCSLQF